MKLLYEALYFANVKMGVVAFPIFILGFVGWIYVVGLSIFFIRQRKRLSMEVNTFQKTLSTTKFPKVDRTFINYYAHMLYVYQKRGIQKLNARRKNIRLQYESAIKQKLSTILMVAAVSPLLGLLGTVLGIIRTFEIITREGTTNAVMLSDGISEALLTTEAGLVLAVPLIFAHAFLKESNRKVVNKMIQLDEVVDKTLR